jgi:hypothetical protein
MFNKLIACIRFLWSLVTQGKKALTTTAGETLTTKNERGICYV